MSQLIPGIVDEVSFKLLYALDQGIFRSPGVARMEFDLGLSEMAGWLLGTDPDCWQGLLAERCRRCTSLWSANCFRSSSQNLARFARAVVCVFTAVKISEIAAMRTPTAAIPTPTIVATSLVSAIVVAQTPVSKTQQVSR